jgi:hypothetical protein
MASTNTTPTSFAARPAGMRRFTHAALLAGGLAIAASAFGHTAIASAEWDIEAYDRCMEVNRVTNQPPGGVADVNCCVYSGGNISDQTGKCVAPPARILQNIPTTLLGPKLGSTQPPVLPTTTLGTPVS